MTNYQVESYLSELERQIRNSNKMPIRLTREWVKCNFENKPAVYIFWEGNSICYVGESACMKGRMGDLLNTKNHTIRRNFGNCYFFNHPLYEKPSSKKSFCPEIEALLIHKMESDLSLSFLYTELGRKELEEFIFEKYSPTYNLKGKRKAK